MTTHYATLGVAENATPDEIKKAYRRLASKHHPDKGGDNATFQNIQAAYDILSNPQRRQQYDLERSGRMPGGFRFTVNGHEVNGFDHMDPNVEQIFRQFGFGGGGDPFAAFRQPRKNKDLRIEIPVDLASTLEEQTKTISVQTTNGHRETVEVKIPRGVTSGTQIKYPGLGDNFFISLPRGDLYVHFAVIPTAPFAVDGIDLHTVIEIDCIDAMIGGETEVKGLDGKTFLINIPPGSQFGTTLRIKEQGLWQLNGSTRGNLLVKIQITVPKNLSQEQRDLIAKFKTLQ